jgi:heat shock protein HtpX
MGLQIRMYLLIAVMFGILYAVIVGIGTAMGVGSALSYIILAVVFVGLQYLISPAIVGWTMKVKWVSEKEEPELHQMVAELAEKAHLPKPKVGISQINVPNAFAYGRTQRDGRICVTQGILRILNKDELRAVLGHEMSHIRHRDMAVITLLSAVPMILYWIAISTMFGGSSTTTNRRGKGGTGNYAALIGIGAFLFYFISNLLVLYGSRIREYYADKGSVELGNQPYQLATALYELVNGSARIGDKQELKKVEGAKALFLNDPSRALNELSELSQVDRNRDGKIDQNELLAVLQMKVRLSPGAGIMEIFTTHPNTLKRIKQLATYAV